MHKAMLEGFRLSPQQARLWSLHQEDRSQPYRTQCAIRIDGDLHPQRLQAALEQVVRRQEILRTTFQCLPAMTLPLQVIAEHCAPAFSMYDISGEEVQAQEDRAEALWSELSKARFDLEHGPLMYASLARFAPDRHLLLLSVPALCADMSGLVQVVRELGQCYAAGFQGETLSSAALQYADLAEWHNALLQAEEADMGRAYWRQQPLADLLTFTLPFGLQHTGQAFVPQGCTVTLEPDLVEQLEVVAQQHATSPAVLLLACWQILLGRFTGQADVLVGMLFDGRHYEELQEAVGLLARYLPLCGHLEEDYTLRDVLTQLDAAVRDADMWQEYFTWDALGDVPEANAAIPCFPCCFEWIAGPGPVRAGAVTFRLSRQEACLERCHLKLTCQSGPAGLQAVFTYDAQRYDGAEIRRLAQHWRTLVSQAVQRPAAPLRDLEWLSAPDAAALRAAGQGTPLPAAPAPPVPTQIEAQAARQPDAIALVLAEHHLSYGALNRRANQLARALRRRGVGPDTLVGLCLPRTLELLVGLLGILKAGGAYVPLDPALPRARLATLLAQAAPRVLLTQAAVAAALPTPGLPVLCLEPDWAGFAQEAPDNIASALQPANVVYVLFTSGSTGQPKGVAIEHRQLSHYVQHITARLALPAAARYATVTTLAADLGHTVVFPALCSGGQLHLVPLETAADAAALAAYVQAAGLDCMKMVPSHLRALLAATPAAPVVPRQWLVLGGEACGWDLVQQVQAMAPACRLLNHYGPTETTVGVLTYPVAPGEAPAARGGVPLGRPLGQTQVYVCDGQGRVVPPWVVGEVYVGGAQVGRGYWQQAALTAERFVPDPWSATPGARLYRTGDLGRLRPDGTVEFVGRGDEQVKVRGFRIELGEIAAVMRQHPAVQSSVVVGQAEGGGGLRLVAYVVGQPGQPLAPRALRQWVAERLPDYMVPAAVVGLERWPLTPNGKLDRAALPPPAAGPGAGAGGAPRTPLEEVVAGIWAEVLGLPQVGVHDDFFALGGHSLLVTRVASRVSAALQVELPFRIVFEQRTVAGLAASIEAIRRDAQGWQVPPLLPVPRHGDLPLSFAQQRLWFFDQLEPQSAAYNIPGVVRLSGRLDVGALGRTFTEILRRHEVLRTTFPSVHGKPRQDITPVSALVLPMIDLSGLPEQERETAARRLTLQQVQRPFALDRGPLLRIGLLRLEAQEHVVFFAMHHIVGDAWSIDILVREVAALYQAFSTGEPSPLPELPVQYADFAAWQQQWLQGDLLQHQVAYWKQQLAGAPQVLELPLDRPRPAQQTWRGARQDLVLSEELTAALKTLSRREGVTLFMTLLAAFQTLLRHYTAQDDLVVGTNTANRSHSQTAGLIGFFVNQLVLRTNLSGNPRFRELLGRVRDTALGAYAHQDLPFDRLVEELQPQRDMSRSLLFQIKFEFQDGTTRRVELPELTLTPVEVDHTIVRHDLHLFMIEREHTLAGALLYNLDLFEADTMARLLGDFAALLDMVVAQPDARLDECAALLTERHVQQQRAKEQELEDISLRKLQNLRRRTIRA